MQMPEERSPQIPPSFPANAEGEYDGGLSAFFAARPRLFGIAYRMLGSVAEAEDIVQDIWLRWQTTNRSVVENPTAFLTTTTTRFEKWINPNIGDLPLSEVNNRALKVLVAKMSDHGLSPKTITGNYVPVVKMVVASAVDEQGEQIYPRKWNHDFIDLPVPQKDKQNTPSFSPKVMTGFGPVEETARTYDFHFMWCGGSTVEEL
jgi:hypothetical protein